MSSAPPQITDPSGLRKGRLRPRVVLALGLLGLLLGALLAQGYYGKPSPALSISLEALQTTLLPQAEEKLLFSPTPQEPTTTPDLLPATAQVIYGFYSVPGVTAVGAPTFTLFRNGKPLALHPVPEVLVAGAGEGHFALRLAQGFTPAVYEVQLQFPETRLAASFVTAHGADAIITQQAPKDATAVINNPVIAAGVSRDGRAVGVGKRFAATQRLYLVFEYKQAEPGSTIQVRWHGEKELITSATREILLPAAQGRAHAWLQAPSPGLPPGRYRAAVNMTADPHELASAEFTVP